MPNTSKCVSVTKSKLTLYVESPLEFGTQEEILYNLKLIEFKTLEEILPETDISIPIVVFPVLTNSTTIPYSGKSLSHTHISRSNQTNLTNDFK